MCNKMNILFKKLKCIELKIQQKIKDTAFLCFVGKNAQT